MCSTVKKVWGQSGDLMLFCLNGECAWVMLTHAYNVAVGDPSKCYTLRSPGVRVLGLGWDVP